MTRGVIETAWARGECPLASGIYYPDDSFRAATYESVTNVLGPVSVDVGARVPLASVDVAYAHAHPQASAHDDELLVTVGEATHGSDGFVAVTRASGALVWLAFFAWSNPFVYVGLEHGEVIAVSNHQTRWRFPVDAPERVQLELP